MEGKSDLALLEHWLYWTLSLSSPIVMAVMFASAAVSHFIFSISNRDDGLLSGSFSLSPYANYLAGSGPGSGERCFFMGDGPRLI